MTMRGLLALLRVTAIESTNISLARAGITDQGIDTLIATAAGIDSGCVDGWPVAGEATDRTSTRSPGRG